jgi:hypothetical protein
VHTAAGLALLFTFAVPGIASLVLGLGNRQARGSDLMLMALTTVAVLYGLMVVISIVGIVMSSNVSCAEASAPPNCDNDIGAGVGLVTGMPVAARQYNVDRRLLGSERLLARQRASLLLPCRVPREQHRPKWRS